MKMTKKKAARFYLGGILVLLLFLFCACSDDPVDYYYTFNNNTQYTIYVSVNRNYSIYDNESGKMIKFNKNDPIILSAKNLVNEKKVRNVDDGEGEGEGNGDGDGGGEAEKKISSKIKISVSNGILDFQWTTDTETDNAKIYSTVSGHTAVFKER